MSSGLGQSNLPSSWFVYLDEAGNTGLNFLDPDQPTYVLAGWIVPANRVDTARSAVTKISLESGSVDLKGSRMMRTPTGREKLERLVKELRELGCCPAYFLCEKRYAVAAKLVDTFLDSEFNDHLTGSFEADVLSKQYLAQQLYNLPDGSLTTAWEAIRAADATQLQCSLNELVDLCRVSGADDLAHLLAGAKSHVARNAAVIANMQAHPVMRHSEALAATSLITIAGAIDSLAAEQGVTSVEVVHDETSSFGPSLEWWFQQVSGPAPVEKPSDIMLTHGRPFRVGYSLVHTLKFADSEEEPLVQAADVLAALLAAAPGRVAGEVERMNPGLVDEYTYLVLLSAAGHPMPCVIMGSEQFVRGVGRAVKRSITRQSKGRLRSL